MNQVITRFAPSPTGDLHIGGARTALYCYLWAKKNNGKFILRIEDTDRTRYQPQSEASIIDGLKWLGLNWDEGPIRQSDNFKLYKEYAENLVKDGKAYYCFCSADRLEKMREIQKKKNLPPRYDGSCQKLEKSEITNKIANGEKYVIRLKVPKQGTIELTDLVRGKIIFDCKDIDDQVLLKSDGFPTYHLANVIDDHQMHITHVIRGEEWIPSTPKHILIYQAFNWQPPLFAHLSLFIKKDGGKLSKREGATSLISYKDQGYLPEAVNNFMAFLGWSPKTEQEFFTLQELVNEFDLTKVHKANPIFDTQKLDFINGYYLRKKTLAEFVTSALPFIKEDYKKDAAYLTKILSLEQERTKKLTDINNVIDYFFNDNLIYEASLLIWKKNTLDQTKEYLNFSKNILNNIENWQKEVIESKLIEEIKTNNFKNGDVLWPLRAALSGLTGSPSPFEIANILGKEKTINRINNAIAKL